jgi:Tfp pilus assembly protein FimV
MSTAPITIPRTSHATLAATVSATSFDVNGEVRAMVRPSIPNYALRRLLVGTAAVVALAFGLVTAVGLSAGLSGSTASAASSADVVAPSVHVAQPGDTMWSIANTYRGDVNRDRYIDALIDANGGAEVQAGAAVLLP